MSEMGQMRSYLTSRGQIRYELAVQHDNLGKFQVIKGDSRYVVEQKARLKAAQWDEMAERRRETELKRREREARVRNIEEKKAEVALLTAEAQGALDELDNLLVGALNASTAFDWETLKDISEFPVVCPPPLPHPDAEPREPKQTDAKYEVRYSLLDMLSRMRKAEKLQLMSAVYERDHANWATASEGRLALIEKQTSSYREQVDSWEEERDQFLAQQAANNAAIDAQRHGYLRGDDPGAIAAYCEFVLANSRYPDYFPHSFDLQYVPASGILIVDYQVPASEALPCIREVRYVQSRDSFDEKKISQGELNRRYDDALYKTALRTVYEMFSADRVNALTAVVFNGYVQTVDSATGQQIQPCLMSLQASIEQFRQINLANVDPKACFRSLKGVSAARLNSLTPIAPLLRTDRKDARFVDGVEVIGDVDGSTNLAAMHWEDFEHLIRELFEEEFVDEGSEVKVTRASHDGGVDAVVFDPDPIRGGKIIVQAKRYTNTVGVAYVRELYGTVMNEGAIKGILVTTSNYGADAYGFAKGKPLTLINGNELLYLMEKHGHRARIDLVEAKRLLADE